MLKKYFRFTKKRIALFVLLLAILFGLQYFLTGSLLEKQQETVEAGNSESAVIGVLDQTELVRQKFKFKRRVVLTEFALSFGSFERDEVGDVVHIQLTDGDNNIVYETSVSVDDITPNATYHVSMDYTVTIPSGVTCCLKLSCSSDEKTYDILPTLNTTNRTDPNTYLSTLKTQTKKKCLNISYTYYYRQVIPFLVYVLELCLLFVFCFERITAYQPVLLRQERRRKKLHKKRRDFSVKELVKWCLIEPKFMCAVRIAAAVLNPLFILFVTEMMRDNLLGMGPVVWIFTWALLFAVQLFFFALTGNMGTAMQITDGILFPLGVANLVVLNVRGTPLLPSDFLALGTAAEVAGTYSISLAPSQFIALPTFVLWCFFLSRTKSKKRQMRVWKKFARSAASLAVSCVTVLLLYNTSVLGQFGIADNVWNKVASCKTNGFYMNFFLNLHYLSVAKPSGYSQEAVAEILEDLRETQEETETETSGTAEFTINADYSTNNSLDGEMPNIILIMNESLADFDLIGQTNYNTDPLAYLHSMTENTIYGIDYVSVFGAGTSNSEFEAMTGNTMAFFPSGSNVYQQFMHDTTYSMAYYLKSLGYSTLAVHPSSGSNWNRVNTYKSMRFDRFITIEEFSNPEYVRYISDKESYKKVIELYEEKEEGTPLFCFDMTIQNHGGYLTNTSWEEPVYVEGAYYTEAKEYLSATKVSDEAFEYLVSYFSEQDEPTIICMFGDHQPSIETAFYEELLGKSESEWELADIQKRYATPFVIWANYDIEEGKDAVVSNNYLGNLLLKQAGIELPLYNQYVEKVSETIPAMNVNGWMDRDGTWHSYGTDETEEVQELLDAYEILQYGYYSDTDKETIGKLFEMEDVEESE